MCGICGILRFREGGVDKDEIGAMTSAIAHRGPDAEGFFLQGPLALGHRRLSIIDLEAGKQPMANEDQQIWIAFNGEIYNYRQLRGELEKAGHVFATNSDTEVILHLYEQYGRECLSRLRGMFAFAIADLASRRLFLARDHFGIKPLYYRLGEGYVAFGSELSSLLAVKDALPAGNATALELYLRFQYIPAPHSVYRTIFKLPPAHWMEIDWEGHCTTPRRYWDLQFSPADERGVREEEWLERVEATITESVRAHLVADVPFGVFLSGGIDSTLVATRMAQILQTPVAAFSIDFTDESQSEMPYARQAAERYGIELFTDTVQDVSIGMIPDLLAHYGEPFGDSSMLPTWYVCRLARRHVPMVLSGDGGDEGFGGYETYLNWMVLDHWAQFKRMAAGMHLASMLRVLGRAFGDLTGRTGLVDRWQNSILYAPAPLRQRLWRPGFLHLTGGECEAFSLAGKSAPRADRLSFAQYMDYQTYLPYDILTKVDVASMYHGLEVRTPLIDVEVASLFTRLPASLRMRYGADGAWQGKYALKQLVERQFDRDFVHRKKRGFAVPRQSLFSAKGVGRQMLEQAIRDPGSAAGSLFDTSVVADLLAQQAAGRNHSSILWVLLVLFVWLQHNPRINFGLDGR